MTESVNIAINIAVTAVAGVGSVTLVSTSRLCYDNPVIVTNCLEYIRFEVIATVAISLLFTILGASGSCCGIPLAKIVAQCIDITVYVAVTAVAGVGGVTLVRAFRSNHNGFVTVTSSRNFYVRCVITTTTSFVCLPTDFRTGCIFGRMLNLVVTSSLHLASFEVITTLTISTLFANCSTSGSLGF